NIELVKRTFDSLKLVPNYSLAGSYVCTRIVIEGTIKAGTADSKAVAAALQGMKYDALTGPEEIPKADHQVIKDSYLLKGKAKSKMKNAADFADVVSWGKSFLAPEQTGCKLV